MHFCSPALTFEELWTKVEEVFWNYLKEKIDASFLSLMDVMNCIIESNGGNDYQLGHHSRLEKHERPGTDVPDVLFVSTKAITWDYPPASYLPTETESETESEESTLDIEPFLAIDL